MSVVLTTPPQSWYLLLETWYLHWWQSPDWSWLGDKTLTDHHDSHCLLMALAASFLGTIFLIWSQVPHYSRELRECNGVFSLLHLLIFPHSKSKNIPGRKYQYNNIGRAVGGEVSEDWRLSHRELNNPVISGAPTPTLSSYWHFSPRLSTPPIHHQSSYELPRQTCWRS